MGSDDALAELTVGAVKELVGRMEKLEQELGVLRQSVEKVNERATTATWERSQIRNKIEKLEAGLPGHTGLTDQLCAKVQRPEAAFRVGMKPSVAAAQDGPTLELLQALRAAGVTRYQDGELVIELGPAAAPRPVAVDAVQDAGRPCPICGMFENLHYRGSVLLGCDKCHEPVQECDNHEPEDALPDAPGPIESPSGIEVDHEALRAKLEERRRATGRAPE